jgi:hypothetical protein
MKPSYSFHPVSLVTNRSSLRKFWEFVTEWKGYVSQQTGKRVKLAWRVEAELVNGTLFLTRSGEDDRKVGSWAFLSPYERELKKAVMKYEAGLEDSLAHHQIVEYSIGMHATYPAISSLPCMT